MRATVILFLAALAAVLAPASIAPAQPFLLGGGSSATASEGPAAAPSRVLAELESPRATVITFLESYRAWKQDQDAASRDRMLRTLDLETFSRVLFGEARYRVGLELGEILSHFRIDERLESIPDRNTLTDPAASTWHLTLERGGRAESFTLVKGDDQAWRFGAATLAKVEVLHDQMFGNDGPLATVFRSLGLGGLVERSMLGLAYYKWIGLFLLIVLGLVADLAVRLFAQVLVRQYLLLHPGSKASAETADLIKRVARPFGWIAGGVLVYMLLPLLEMPIQAESVLRTAAKAFALMAGVWAAYRIVDMVAESYRRRAGVSQGGMQELLIPLLTKAVKVFILALGLVFIAESLNLPITSLLAGVGLAGAAIAIAARGTLENVFGTMTVILDKPFRIGDWIKVADVEGTVENISFRSTRVRTFANSLVTVPNSNIINAAVDNYGMREFRRWKTMLNLDYDTPAPMIDALCQGVRELILRHPGVRKDELHVHLHEFGPHSLDVIVVLFFVASDWETELRARHEIAIGIIELGRELGVRFAFPTRTVHIATLPAPPAGTRPIGAAWPGPPGHNAFMPPRGEPDGAPPPAN